MWSTGHHINHYDFLGTNDNKEMEGQSCANMSLFLLRNYTLPDLTAMVINIDKQPSFLITSGGGSDEEHDEDVPNRHIKEDNLPFQQKSIQVHISKDIAGDKRIIKEILAGKHTGCQ